MIRIQVKCVALCEGDIAVWFYQGKDVENETVVPELPIAVSLGVRLPTPAQPDLPAPPPMDYEVKLQLIAVDFGKDNQLIVGVYRERERAARLIQAPVGPTRLPPPPGGRNGH
jgi:hypothetical protein